MSSLDIQIVRYTLSVGSNVEPITAEGTPDPVSVRAVDFEERLEQLMLTQPARTQQALSELDHRLDSENIKFAGKRLPTFIKPHVIPRLLESDWAAAVAHLLTGMEALAHRVLDEPDLMAQLRLPPGSKELLEIDPGYKRIAVVCRPDLVWRRHDASVLEVNVDSPAMMTFTDKVEQILLDLFPLGELRREYKLQPLSRTRALLDSLLACYKEWGGTREDPTIAIVDWKGEATACELLHTAEQFEAYGCPTVVCDPRELRLFDGKLYAGSRRIDLVQRRVLFPDFIRRKDELEPLVTAYRTGKVCVANPLRAYSIGNKMALALMYKECGNLGLAPEAIAAIQRLVPRTVEVTDDVVARVREERRKWVIKGAFGSGGRQVTIGTCSSASEWEEAISRGIAVPSVAQRLRPIPTYRVPYANPRVVRLAQLYANWNPWFFNGRYAGATTRVGRKPVVGITGGGGLLPAFAV